MRINILFIVLTFIIIIAVILLADSLMSAMLIVSLLANFLVISAQFGKISRNVLDISAKNWGVPQKVQTAAEPVEKKEEEPIAFDDQPTDLYGPFYEMWHAYQDGYTACYAPPQMVVGTTCAERGYNVDEANAFMAQKRARDRKCMDGLVSKDANYYKHHFGGELDQAEAKPWWSRGDF